MLALIIWPTVALLAATGLVAVAPRCNAARYLLPAVRTVALITAATVYVAAVWSH